MRGISGMAALFQIMTAGPLCAQGAWGGGWDGSGRPKSRLAILPGLTHYTIFTAPALAATVIPFLDEPT